MNYSTQKRYYQVGERVWVKPAKKLGFVKELNIVPSENIYKAIVDVDGAHMELNLWEINKDRSEEFKNRNANQPVLYWAKIREDAIIPSKNEEDAGYDIYANFEEEYVVIYPDEIKMIPTGVASAVSEDWVLVARERGSTGTKGMAVRAGVIDSGFRGEIFIPINNTSRKIIVISKLSPEDTMEKLVKSDDFYTSVMAEQASLVHYPYSKAIAQLLLLPVPKPRVKEITYEELQRIPSKRGTGALGSTNK